MIEPKRGSSFLYRDFNVPKFHLSVILNDPNELDEMLIVPISSIKQGSEFDPVCVIEEDEHPWLSRKSFAIYKYAYPKTVPVLRNISELDIVVQEDASDELIDKLIQGALDSKTIKPKLRRFAEEHC